MPSFVCDHCQETLKKAKLDSHTQRCRQAAFSCIDCYKTFKGSEYREHFSCITEVQKYHQKQPATIANNVNKTKTIKSSPSPPVNKEKTFKVDSDSDLITAIKSVLNTSTSTASLKVVKKKLKKSSVGKGAKKTLQEKIVFSLNKETNELVIKLDQ